jgi:hypothetical protein
MTALPHALDRFGAELEIAIRRDLGARRRRRRLLRATALSAAAAAAALGILAVMPGGGSSVVRPAAAALEVSDNTILHLEMRGEQHNPDRSVVTWRSESWQLGEAPFTRRQIEVGLDGIRAETLVRGDTEELFDAETNTIYIASQKELAASQPLPKIKIVSEARLRQLTQGSPRDLDAALRYRVTKSGRGYAVIATKEGAKRLREQRARAQDSGGADGAVEEPFRAEILALLNSGRAREVGRVEVDGRDAIRIESPDGRQVYLVDAVTYAPIEWTSTGNGGSVTLRFPVYEELPVNANSMELFDLEAQHPGARVERDPAAYQEAEARLFPHG